MTAFLLAAVALCSCAAPAACDVFLVYEEADAPARVLAAAAALRRSGKSVRIGRRAPEGMTVLTLSEVEI